MATLQPVLVVGVGGSGVKTLMALRSVLLRRLRALPGGWTEDRLPAAWQLLAIDTEWEQPPDFDAPRLPDSSYHSLVPRVGTEEPRYQDLVRPLINRISPDARADVVGGWMERRYDHPPSRGAGQFRAIGRAVAVADLSGLRAAIAAAHSRLEDGTARTELAGIASDIGAVAGSSVLPVLVTSVAGGTGAGMFVDVVEAMRSVRPGLATDVQVLLYGPDVFRELLDTQKGVHIPANALAAVSEITAGVWADATTPGTRQLYELGDLGTAGLDVDAGENAFGARYHYLVGRANLQGEDVGKGEDAYWAVADALGGMITDPSILGPFRSYFITNVFNNTADAGGVGDESGLSVPNETKYLQPFASLGAGRLSVGSERLHEYAVQALTRSAVERLLWPMFAPADAAADVGEVAERAWCGFIETSGLDERDSFVGDRLAEEVAGTREFVRRDEVIDAIRRPVLEDLVVAAVRRVIEEAASGTESQGISADEWTNRLLGALERELPTIESQLADAVLESTREFARGAEALVLRRTSAAAADRGFAVADALLARLDAELRFVGEEQLPTQATAERRRVDEIPGGLALMLQNSIGTGVADGRSDAIGEVRGALERSLLGWVSHPLLCRAAARLLLAIRAELLPAVRDALRTSRSLLERDLGRGTATDRAGAHYETFPRLRQPGSGSGRIGPTEVVLVPPERHASEFEAAARATVKDFADQWDQRLVALTLRRLPLGTEEAPDEGTGMFEVDRAWMPSDPDLRWVEGADPAQPVHHAFRSVRDVVDTAEALLRDRDTPVGRLGTRTLREYLDDGGPAERDARAERFVAGLVEVMRKSAPLTTLNTAAIAAVHPRADVRRPSRIVSTIPVPVGHPVHERMRRALEAAGVWGDELEQACAESTATHVDVFQALGTSLGPASFTTTTELAWNRWCKLRADEAGATAFWNRKRARPLLEALPIAGPSLRRLVAGWFTGLPLGLVVEEARGGNGRFVAVHDPETGAHAPGPHPLFRRGARGAEVLPALLESLPLAVAHAGVEGSLQPLRPYTLLIRAGADLARGDGPVHRWLADGSLPRGVVPALGDVVTATPEDRRAALAAVLDAEADAVRAAVGKWEGIVSAEDRMWEVTPVVELAGLLLDVIAETRDAIGAGPAAR